MIPTPYKELGIFLLVIAIIGGIWHKGRTYERGIWEAKNLEQQVKDQQQAIEGLQLQLANQQKSAVALQEYADAAQKTASRADMLRRRVLATCGVHAEGNSQAGHGLRVPGSAGGSAEGTEADQGYGPADAADDIQAGIENTNQLNLCRAFVKANSAHGR